MTLGQIMFYGGVAMIVIGILAIILCVPLFSRQRKKMEEKIKEEYI